MFDWQLCVHVLGLGSFFALSTDEAVNVHNDMGGAWPKGDTQTNRCLGPLTAILSLRKKLGLLSLLFAVLLLLGFSCLLRVCLCVCGANINRGILCWGCSAGTNIEIGTGSTPYAGWSENESFADIFVFIYFNRHTRILELQQDCVRSKTLSMKLWHCWHWGFGRTWASAFLSGWMLLARWVDFMRTVGSSTRILTRRNITLFILPASIFCAHLRSTKNSTAIGYFDKNIWSRQDKTFCCRSDSSTHLHTNLFFWSLFGRWIPDLLWFTHSRSTQK